MRSRMPPPQRGWTRASHSRRDTLALLEKKRPLLSRDVPETSVEPWPFAGWTTTGTARGCWSRSPFAGMS